MLDADPGGRRIAPPSRAEWKPERVPTDAEVLHRGCGQPGPQAGPRSCCSAPAPPASSGKATRNPVLVAAANQVRDSLRGPLGTLLNVGRRLDDEDVDPPPAAAYAPGPPRTPFNAHDHRRTAASPSARRSLEAVKDIKNAMGATVNDVVMAVCAGGLRT